MANRFDIIEKKVSGFLEKTFGETLREREIFKPLSKEELTVTAAGFTSPLQAKPAVEIAETALSKLIGAIKGAKPIRKEISALQSAERTTRAGAAEQAMQAVPGEKGFVSA